MELIEDVFVGGNVTDLETVLSRLRRQIPVLHIYCIVLFEDRMRLELLSSHELFQKRNLGRPGKIAGIAMGRAEAMELLVYMIETALENGRDCSDPQQLIQ